MNLSPESSEFWAFSWDQMAQVGTYIHTYIHTYTHTYIHTYLFQYDVPSVIDYILNTTGYYSLTYVGHSQGTTQMFAALIRYV